MSAAPLRGRAIEEHVLKKLAETKTTQGLLMILDYIDAEQTKYADQPDVVAYIEISKQHAEKKLAEIQRERKAKEQQVAGADSRARS